MHRYEVEAISLLMEERYNKKLVTQLRSESTVTDREPKGNRKLYGSCWEGSRPQISGEHAQKWYLKVHRRRDLFE